MSRAIPGTNAIRNARRKFRDWRWDIGLPAAMALLLRDQALGQPPDSAKRRILVAWYRGFLAGMPAPGFVIRHRNPSLPDQVRDDIEYHAGFASGELLAAVMWELAVSLRHADLADPWPLWLFAAGYGTSVTSTSRPEGGSPDWVRDSATLMRLHAASCYEAEARGYGVGERVELEFLRALAKRVGLPLPADATDLIAERRRDSKNLPTGLDWIELPKPAAAGGPSDGSLATTAEGTGELRNLVRQLEWSIILDEHGDGELVRRGVLAGLTATDRVPVEQPEGTDHTFHGGLLCGSLQAAFVRAHGPARVDLARLYAYAAALNTPRVQSALRQPQPNGLLAADAMARHHVRTSRGLELDDAEALACFNWLAEQLEVPVTPKVLEKREHIVVRPANPGSQEPPQP
jgi:hypothetical protein